jgi:hypothetical protein
MFCYAKDPDQKNRWVLFSEEGGIYTRICSFAKSPASKGYAKIKWPEKYEGAPLTAMIKVVNNAL